MSSGNFVDVPSKFKSIVDNWSTDRKQAAEAAKSARESAKGKAFADFSNGAQPFMVDTSSKMFDSWDDTEVGFAKALEKAAQ